MPFCNVLEIYKHKKEWPENQWFPGQVNREASRLGDEGSTDPFRTTSDDNLIIFLPPVVVPVLHHTAMQKTHGSLQAGYRTSNRPGELRHQEVPEHGYTLGMPHFFGIDEIGFDLRRLHPGQHLDEFIQFRPDIFR